MTFAQKLFCEKKATFLLQTGPLTDKCSDLQRGVSAPALNDLRPTAFF